MADRALAAVAVVLCVVALALAASSLSASGGLERGPGEGSGPRSSDAPRAPPDPPNRSSAEPIGLSGDWVAILVAATVLLALPSAFFVESERLLGAILAVAFLAVVVGILSLTAGNGGGGPLAGAVPNGTAGMAGGGEMGSAAESTSESPTDLPSMLTVGVVGIALVAAVGLVYFASSSVDESVDPEPRTEPEPAERPGVAEAAGRAADRIDDHEGDAENAVYAAWTEMTTALDAPDPATSTPGEFADAAVAAGMDGARVDELTDLFERVRYGHEPVTADHERRASSLLREIETAHESVDAAAASDAATVEPASSDAVTSDGNDDADEVDGSDGPDEDATDGDRAAGAGGEEP